MVTEMKRRDHETAKKEHASQLVTIGWREYVALPDWGIAAIKTKADTGARTSAIDVSNLEELPDDRVRFNVMYDRIRDHYVAVEAAIVRRTRVKSSFGAAHDRLFVSTTMTLGPVTKEIQIGLVNRKSMHCRMLLGRAALLPDFVVDSGHMYLQGRKKRTKKKRATQATSPGDSGTA